MPAPTPLTETPPPDLDWSRPGTPAARGFDDIYFSTDGGLQETQSVFLHGCGMPEIWNGRKVFTIAELGFGTGLNFLAARQMWDTHSPDDARLHFVSIEKYPLDQDQLRMTLGHWPELAPYADELIARWPGRVRGMHRIEFGRVVLTLVHDDISAALDQLSMQADAWFLDGFSPAKNPDMWTPEVMQKIAGLSAPGARLATFSVAGHIRSSLSAAGFTVEKKPGFGRKRHRLEARFDDIPSGRSKPPARPVIIGAGIGGASLARAFIRRGVTPVIVDPEEGTAASGNPAAIIKPRLDLQDRTESRFFLGAFGYAVRAYQSAECVISQGVYHLEKSNSDKIRFEKLLKHRALPADQMQAATGEYSGIYFSEGLIIDPAAARRAFMQGAKCVQGAMTRYDAADDCVHVLDLDGKCLAEGDSLFIAAGAGVRELSGIDWPAVRFSRGQISRAKGDLRENLTYGGYAVPLKEALLLGATHDRLDDRDPYVVRGADDQKNLAEFEAITGFAAELDCNGSRASIRVNMPDTLPRCLKIEDNIFAMTGLGSRGFVFAPLLAESCISALFEEPLPLPKSLWARFQAREKPNQKARPV